MRKILLFIIFVLGFGMYGQQADWMKMFYHNSPTTVAGVVKDSNGNICIAGNYVGDYQNENTEASGVFISKYNSAGNLLWTDTITSHGYINCTGIITDDKGNVFMSIDKSPFCYYPITIGNNDYNCYCVVKYSSVGQLLWVKQYPSNIYFNPPIVCTIDNSTGYIYARPDYHDPLRFDSLFNYVGFPQGNLLIYMIALDGQSNMFAGIYNEIRKFDLEGNDLWTYTLPSLYLKVRKMVTDLSGNCYFTAIMNASSYLLKLNSAGQLVWKDSLSYSVDGIERAALYADNNGVYLCGRYQDSTGHGMCVNKYDSNGSLLWSYRLTDVQNQYFYEANGITADNGAVYVSGINTSEYSEGYLLKLLDPFSTNVIDNLEQAQFRIFPNPSEGKFLISGQTKQPSIKIYNSFGEKINFKIQNNEIDLSSQPKGIYFVEIMTDGKRTVKKIILE